MGPVLVVHHVLQRLVHGRQRRSSRVVLLQLGVHDLPYCRPYVVVLEIAGDGSFLLNSEAVARSLLRDRLIAVFERRGERVLFVKAAAGLAFAVVAAAIDTAHGANIDRVALLPR